MPWNLEFIGFYLLECEPTDWRCLFVDAAGQAWRQVQGRMLVQSDDMDDRALPVTLTYPNPGERKAG